ncbi:MAG: hypothetical protein AAF573_13020 [Bacteroidota bacterium]
MKKSLALFTFILLGNFIFAQSKTSNATYDRQVGVDFTSLVTLLLGNDGAAINPSTFLYLRKGDDKKKRRISLGARILLRERDTDNDMSNRLASINFGIGREFYTPIAKNLNLFYGWEVLTNFQYNYSQVDNINSNSVFQIGLGGQALLGLQYRISKRFSIFTEAGYVVRTTYNRINQNDGDFTANEYQLSSSFRSPRILVLSFDF